MQFLTKPFHMLTLDTTNSAISAHCQLHLTVSYRHAISLNGSPIACAILFINY
jgi:hypothetical protein